MVVRRYAAIAGTAALVLIAGCLDGGTDIEAEAHDHGAMLEAPWSMSSEGCLEGGFVAVYPMGEDARLADVWRLADIREEVGHPMRDSLGQPLDGPARGNWHQGFRCETASVDGVAAEDFQFGFIGDVVHPPEWDTGGADLHFLVSGFGLLDSPLRDSLADVTTADVSHAIEARVDWLAPSTVYTLYDDQEKGTYESYGIVEPYRIFEERTIRLWWTVPADGSDSHLGHGHGDDAAMEGKWNPVYWDVHTSGGQRQVTPQIHSVELACHSGEGADHGPQGGACQPTLTLLQEHASIEITYGGVVPDVVLDEVWVH